MMNDKKIDPIAILGKYYDSESKLYTTLLVHSKSVAEKAADIARQHPEMNLDIDFIIEAALLHDIGIFLCNAPSIGCFGEADYICHGYLGADLMRKEGYLHHALVCERHTGTGISLEEIKTRNLPLPHRDMIPISMEEQLICFADKFFSKTNPDQEKSIAKIVKGLSKYGDTAVSRFTQWCTLFLGQ